MGNSMGAGAWADGSVAGLESRQPGKWARHRLNRHAKWIYYPDNIAVGRIPRRVH